MRTSVWVFPNGNTVTTVTYYQDWKRLRNYIVFIDDVVVGCYPPTPEGWCDALVHAARGEPI